MSQSKMNRPILLLKDNYESVQRLNPMLVRQVLRLPSGYTYPICPACRITLDREYQSYCDRCGQCLNWNRFEKAVIIQWTKEYKNTRLYEMSENNDGKDPWHRVYDQLSSIKTKAVLQEEPRRAEDWLFRGSLISGQLCSCVSAFSLAVSSTFSR